MKALRLISNGVYNEMHCIVLYSYIPPIPGEPRKTTKTLKLKKSSDDNKSLRSHFSKTVMPCRIKMSSNIQ